MKDIPGFEGLYAASEEGQIYSYRRKGFLSLYSAKGWYIQIRLCKDGVQQVIRVHKIIASLFVDKPDGATEVNHKNGIKTDNRAENLEWVNRSRNVAHTYSHLGRKPVTGSKHPKHRLILDFETGIYYDSSTEAAEANGISRVKLLNNIKNRNYKKRFAPYRYNMRFV